MKSNRTNLNNKGTRLTQLPFKRVPYTRFSGRVVANGRRHRYDDRVGETTMERRNKKRDLRFLELSSAVAAEGAS
jgi:hypothetical protein